MTNPFSGLISEDFLDFSTQAEDEMFRGLAVACTLIYPPTRQQCPNCVQNPFSHHGGNVYKSGGPVPFTGGLCPICNGENFKVVENTESIQLQVAWQVKGFLDLFKQKAIAQAPKTFIQIKALNTDLPKIIQSIEFIINTPLTPYIRYRFTKASEAIPSGIRQNKYCYLLLERIS